MKDFPFWSLIKEGAAQGSMNLDTNNPLNPAGPRSLRLDIDERRAWAVSASPTRAFLASASRRAEI